MQMAESQKKATPSAKSKEKSSLLDLDIGDDFLGSWKSMSMGNDGMDFDFGTTSKGKKKDFNFDKMDMDFSLDADFGKLPSFKTDMSDLDISSPIKKSGKSKETSKEASSGGDDFAFSFDFNKFADLDFGSTKKKTDEKSDNSKDNKEGYSNTSGSRGTEDLLAKDVNALEDDDTSSKHPISKVDTQMENIEDPGSRNEDDHLKTVTYESSNAEEQEIQTTISSEKIISSNFEEPTQESHSSEERSSSELDAQKAVQELSGHSVDNASDLPEEESGTSVRMVNPRTGAEKNGSVRSVDEVVTTRSLPLESLSAHMNLQSQKGEMCKEREDNVLTGHIKGDSHLESSMTTVKENLAHGETVDKRNADSVSKLHMGSLNSGTTSDELVSKKERGNITTQSKYFKKQNGSESEKPQASISSTKLISVANKRMSTLPNNLALGKSEFASKSGESGSKFAGISRPLPNVLTRNIPCHTKNTETNHASDNTGECLNADNIKPRIEPMSTTVGHDTGPTKEEPALRGREQNTVHISSLRSDVHPSRSMKQSTKDLPHNNLNPGLQATSMKSTCNIGKNVVEKNQISSTKADIRVSEVSTLRVSRATEPKLKPLNSMLPSMRNKEQEKTMLTKQTPSTPTLKRKTFEASAETLTWTPLKRLSTSPCSNNIAPSSEKAVNKQIHNHARMANEMSPRIDVSPLEIDIYSASENDALFQQAEAYKEALRLQDMSVCLLLVEDLSGYEDFSQCPWQTMGWICTATWIASLKLLPSADLEKQLKLCILIEDCALYRLWVNKEKDRERIMYLLAILKNADSVSKLHMGSLDSETTSDELVSEKEKGNIPTRSKYFKRQNGSESEKPHASISSTKLISVANKRMSTLPNNLALGKRECLNADKIKPIIERMSTTVGHDTGPTKEEPALMGREQNTVHINSLRSDVHLPRSMKQSTKDLLHNNLNPGLQATSMKSSCNVGKMRLGATEPKLKPLNCRLPMGPPSMRNKEQEKTILQKQTPSTPTLKRKTFEASAETPTWTPLKRFYITLQIHNHASMANETSSRLDVSPLEIDIYSASENDALFQQAEACSKELDVLECLFASGRRIVKI
ncbi:hypothetical protein L2E82_14948 [Cichorium intybus]|uniref:Uncharacterized protein n=1 Tax=Cichorium intybus TaxID=13427 RepID=A0ACB9F1T6_CICIN|nr:hypothetical protein L2E82_14948 [Cichorium intybus]